MPNGTDGPGSLSVFADRISQPRAGGLSLGRIAAGVFSPRGAAPAARYSCRQVFFARNCRWPEPARSTMACARAVIVPWAASRGARPAGSPLNSFPPSAAAGMPARLQAKLQSGKIGGTDAVGCIDAANWKVRPARHIGCRAPADIRQCQAVRAFRSYYGYIFNLQFF